MNPTTIRLNEQKDKDLIEFFKQRGLKQGIRYLYDFYNQNQNIVETIVSQLKDLDIKPKTEIKPKRLEEIAKTNFNYEDDFINNFK